MSKQFNEITNPEVRVFDIECYGCAKHEKDIMVTTSFGNEEEGVEHFDIFLTLTEAYQLQKDLDKKIEETEAFISRIFELHNEGLSSQNIARHMMKNVKVIDRILQDFKVKG